MSTYILTSMFPDGFDEGTGMLFDRALPRRGSFAFVASDFEHHHDVTDSYFTGVLDWFKDAGIQFDRAYTVNGRMTAEEAQKAVREADVVWLSGGDTLAQFASLKEYGLVDVIRRHTGVVIGMSAGTINMAKIAVLYDPPYGVHTATVYSGIGCVDISVDPHFEADRIAATILNTSEEHVIYGLCDNGIIVCRDGQTEYYGEVYRLRGGEVERIN